MEADGWSPIAKVYDPLMVGSIDTTDDEPHDHGIVRAMNAKYKPNKDVTGDPNNTVFVARLNPKTVEETLQEEFSFFGEIKNLRLIRDIVTGTSRCYAFIEYEDESSAYRSQRDGSKMILDGSEIFVDFELERTLRGWIPRRLGGGFGGKKESGQLRFGGKDRPFKKPIMANARLSDSFGKGRSGRGYDNEDRHVPYGQITEDERNGYRDTKRDIGRPRDRERQSRDTDSQRDRYHQEREKESQGRDRHRRDEKRRSRDRERRSSKERRDGYRERS